MHIRDGPEPDRRGDHMHMYVCVVCMCAHVSVRICDGPEVHVCTCVCVRMRDGPEAGSGVLCPHVLEEDEEGEGAGEGDDEPHVQVLGVAPDVHVHVLSACA